MGGSQGGSIPEYTNRLALFRPPLCIGLMHCRREKIIFKEQAPLEKFWKTITTSALTGKAAALIGRSRALLGWPRLDIRVLPMGTGYGDICSAASRVADTLFLCLQEVHRVCHDMGLPSRHGLLSWSNYQGGMPKSTFLPLTTSSLCHPSRHLCSLCTTCDT